MDGTTLRVARVGALKGYLHPITVARAVMEKLPHVFLAGEGAARFAREIGAEAGDNLIPDSRRVWQAWYEAEVPESAKRLWPDAPLVELCRHAVDPEVGHDTTVFLAQDKERPDCRRGQHLGVGLEVSGRLGDFAGDRRRHVCRHALRRLRLHGRRRDDDPRRHGPRRRPLYEDGDDRRCGGV